MLRDAGIEVVTGVLEDECRALNRRFMCLHEKHRPYVILKWAQTADGFLDYDRSADSAANRPLVISNAVTKQLVHKMRAENMAIMVGTRTALLDNPRLLTTRWSGRNPIRVLPDRHGVVPRDSRIFSGDSETIVYSECTDWQYILSDLGQRGIHSLLVEGGRIWLETIIESGIWDEMHIEVSPVRIAAGIPAPKVPIGIPAPKVPAGIPAPQPPAGIPAPHIPLGEANPMTIQGHLLYVMTHNAPL